MSSVSFFAFLYLSGYCEDAFVISYISSLSNIKTQGSYCNEENHCNHPQEHIRVSIPCNVIIIRGVIFLCTSSSQWKSLEVSKSEEYIKPMVWELHYFWTSRVSCMCYLLLLGHQELSAMCYRGKIIHSWQPHVIHRSACSLASHEFSCVESVPANKSGSILVT